MAKLIISAAVTRRGRLVISAVLVVVVMAGYVIAQQRRPSPYESIELGHISAGQAAQRVHSAYGRSLEVVVDDDRNRLLVSGPAAEVASARQFVSNLDRPVVPASYSTTSSTPRGVVAYHVRPNDLQPLADMLQASYTADSGLSIATDQRLNQILVVAPQRVQAEIESIMRNRGYAPEADQAQSRNNVAPFQRSSNEQLVSTQPNQPSGIRRQDPLTQDQSVSRVYSLSNLSWREFEAAIVRTWGNRLDVTSERNGEWVTVQLPAPQGVSAEMSIDRINGQIHLSGPETIVGAWHTAIQSIDVAQDAFRQESRWIAIEDADVDEVRRAVSYLRLASSDAMNEGEVSTVIPIRQDEIERANRAANGQDDTNPNLANQDDNVGAEGNPNASGQDDAAGTDDPNQETGDDEQEPGGLVGPVRLEFIEELGIIVAIGNPQDTARVEDIVQQIIELSQYTLPHVELYALQNVDSLAISTVILELYDQVFAARQEPVSITPLLKPNALLLVGQEESVVAVKSFIEQLDVPVPPSNEFKVISLEYMSAVDAKLRIDEHYNGIQAQTGFGAAGQQLPNDDIRSQLAVRVRVTADYRSNAIVVSASPRDLAEIEAMIKGLDTNEPEGSNRVRIIRLRNSLAEELAPVLQDVLNGQLIGAGIGYNPSGNIGNQQALGGGVGAAQQQPSRIRSTTLELMTVDQEGREILMKGGINFDVRVTADINSNSLLVQGPEENMDLIEALVKELDRLPDAETVVKVYQLVHGDASKLLDLLQALFGTDQQTQGVSLPLQSGTVGDSSTLVALRFAIDTRTNSLIFSGSEADIRVIEDILIRLDAEEFEDRIVNVTRLSNASSDDVAAAVQLWLDGRADLNSNEDLYSIYQQAERTIIVVSEPASNSLIVSATPEFMPEIERVIETLDRRPPMIMIQVMLAQIALGDTEEFGFEMGIQDSLLFDRGRSNIGFNFNQGLIGNDNTAASNATREDLAGIALSNLNVGRTNGTLGFGGLVLSAGNESINLLLRALKQRNRAQILSRPQIMTMENLTAFVQVGQRVPYITDTTLSNFGQTNTTTFVDVGVLLQVTPRVGRDGSMVLIVEATNSELGPEAEGIPISINQNGDAIRSPRIDIITASTTVMAKSGQTVVMGGLIQKTNTDIMRGVPIISDIPGIGQLFRFDGTTEERNELLIIMTPYLVTDEDDIHMLNQMEMDRMSWCMADVAEVHGQIGYGDFDSYIQSVEPATIYPDLDPTGSQPMHGGEDLNTPMGQGAMNGFQSPQPANPTGRRPAYGDSTYGDAGYGNTPNGNSRYGEPSYGTPAYGPTSYGTPNSNPNVSPSEPYFPELGQQDLSYNNRGPNTQQPRYPYQMQNTPPPAAPNQGQTRVAENYRSVTPIGYPQDRNQNYQSYGPNNGERAANISPNLQYPRY